MGNDRFVFCSLILKNHNWASYKIYIKKEDLVTKKIEKHIIFFLNGRSIRLGLNKKNEATFHLAEGIVHDGKIAWCNPSPPNMLMVSSGGDAVDVSGRSDLKEGQEVSLVVKSYTNIIKIIPEKFDVLVNKVREGDEEAIKTINEAAD